MTLLTNEEFLRQLAVLYMEARLGGPKSVYVTMKPSMTLLTNEEFLRQLAVLYMEARLGGPKSVYVTMKPYDGRAKAMPKDVGLQSDVLECLFRAKLGNKKISTCVAQKESNKFHGAYVSVLRANMDGLQKRKKEDEKPQKKTNASSKV